MTDIVMTKETNQEIQFLRSMLVFTNTNDFVLKW